MKRFLLCLSLAALCLCVSLTAKSSASADTAEFSTTARAAVVMERSSRRVLYSRNADERLPMASTTKIVTALTVLNNANLDETVEIPQKAVGIEGSSVYLCAGERLTVRELLLGLMLRSGNDCAVALALHTGGSVEAFAEMMNKTARDLGCEDSNFVNPHGLPDDDHYTSARDLAVITCEALNNDDFCQIVSAKTARISNGDGEGERLLVNKNKLLNSYMGADGVKTGYTKKAGRCFVGSATRNGMQVVVVVLNCPPMFEETAQMLDAAFATYSMQTAVPQNKVVAIRKGNGVSYYRCPERCRYPVKADERLRVETDEAALTLNVSLNGERVWTYPLQKIR